MSAPNTGKDDKQQRRFEKAVGLVQSGQTREAENILKGVVKKIPQHVDAIFLLAEIARETRRYDLALRRYTEALKINPNLSEAWRNLGLIQFSIYADIPNAINAFTQALALNQNDPLTYLYMGTMSYQINQFDDAIELLKIGLQLAPSNAEMMSLLGVGQVRQRHFEDGKKNLMRALQIMPNNPRMLSNLLSVEAVLKLTEAERQTMADALNQHRQSPELKNEIALYEATKFFDQGNLERAEKALEVIENDQSHEAARKYYFLGNLAREKKDYDSSFDHYEKANSLIRKTPQAQKYRLDAVNGWIENVIKSTNDQLAESIKKIADWNTECPYPEPVFLVGFPRSGTTLTGRILDQHPEIHVADEHSAIQQSKIHLAQQHQIRLPEDIDKTTPEHMRYLHALYNEKQLGEPAKNKSGLFIDKTPLGEIDASVAQSLFPKAKFLYISRHPVDAVLSGFMQFFNLNAAMIHFLDIKTTAELYVKTYDAWKTQKTTLPLNYYEFKYEDLVADFDNEVGKILDFLGLEWDDAVREFYKDRADGPATLTPSRKQVSKKLYSGSKNRWKHYEKHLQPAIEILEPVIKELGYSLD